MIVVAAGDRNKYTCAISPASSRTVIVAAATSRETDMEILGSNFGECVHIYAPGEDLLTSTAGSLDATVRISGSSASAALVTSIWSTLLGVYSEPENLKLQLDDEDPKEYALTDADRVLLLKDSLLHPVSGYRSSSVHEDSWIACEFSTPESALRHMNQRYRDWMDTGKAMKKFTDPSKRREFLSSRAAGR
jgi:subtilisin family serine protease